MPAETLNCPMCGAAASSDATQCEHCGARLATVACPSCFGMIFQGAKFCSHCGAAVARTEVVDRKPKLCPRCRIPMESVVIGNSPLQECKKCEGLWADVATINQIYNDREKQAAVLGTAAPLETNLTGDFENVHYLPCPVCQQMMNRVNFANCSHVIVDVCKPHGTWFDKDELRRIVEFIRAGGMDKARAMQIQELEDQRRRLESARSAPATDPDYTPGFGHGDRHLGLSFAAAVLDSLFDSKRW
jgi:Zn-finger nucleic acid-binding protein